MPSGPRSLGGRSRVQMSHDSALCASAFELLRFEFLRTDCAAKRKSPPNKFLRFPESHGAGLEPLPLNLRFEFVRSELAGRQGAETAPERAGGGGWRVR